MPQFSKNFKQGEPNHEAADRAEDSADEFEMFCESQINKIEEKLKEWQELFEAENLRGPTHNEICKQRLEIEQELWWDFCVTD